MASAEEAGDHGGWHGFGRTVEVEDGFGGEDAVAVLGFDAAGFGAPAGVDPLGLDGGGHRRAGVAGDARRPPAGSMCPGSASFSTTWFVSTRRRCGSGR